MTFFKMFKDKLIVKRLLFTIFVIVLYEIGSIIPVPNVDASTSQKVLSKIPALQALGYVGGGAFKRFSLFALGISPFITSQIIIQMLQMDIIPKLAEWNKEGEIGRRKTTRVTRIVALFIAFLQGIGFSYGIDAMSGGVILTGGSTFLNHSLVALYFTFGTVIALWFADLISDKGIGNGTSILIVTGIVGTIPSTFINTIMKLFTLKSAAFIAEEKKLIITVIVLLVILFLSVYVYLAERKIPIRYANKQGSNKISSKANLPLKVNIAGVVPVIFSYALIKTPNAITGFFPKNTVAQTINNLTDTSKPLGMILFTLLVVSFSYFYVLVQINPKKVAENVNKSGGFIPHIRPGVQTEQYIKGVMIRLTFYGSLYLSLLSLMPMIATNIFKLSPSFSIGGTGILIIIGVAIETWKKISAKINTKTYDIFK